MGDLAETLIFSMAIAAALFALGQLIFRKKTARNYLLAIGVSCLCCVLLYFWAVGNGAIRRVPLLLYSNITITFLVGPSVYLSFRLIVRNAERLDGPYWPHFVPLPIVAAAVAAYDIPCRPLAGGPSAPIPGQLSSPGIYAMSLASDLYMFAYMLAANIEALRRVRAGGLREAKRLGYFRAYLLGLLLSAFLTLLAYALSSEAFLAIGAAAFGVLVIGYAIYCSSAAGLDRSQWFGEGGRKDDKLRSVDAVGLVERLSKAIDLNKAFKDPGLSLAVLAKELGVSPQQLSQLINDRMGVNFRSFVNARRIEEVKRELVRFPDKTILEIALENGFNSKTAFNTEFARSCGQSPRDYRKSRA
jgi:AraC-like DNA-binding protein